MLLRCYKMVVWWTDGEVCCCDVEGMRFGQPGGISGMRGNYLSTPHHRLSPHPFSLVPTSRHPRSYASNSKISLAFSDTHILLIHHGSFPPPSPHLGKKTLRFTIYRLTLILLPRYPVSNAHSSFHLFDSLRVCDD